MGIERWISIDGFEDRYEVSDLGRVRNVKTDYVLSPSILPSGHLSVFLGNKGFSVHGLVMRAFGRRQPANTEVRHLNGKPFDNRSSNLVWSSRGDNMRDIKWHGGRRGYKLDPNQIREIKEQITMGKTQRQIAREFSVNEGTVSKIKLGKLHADVVE